MKRAPLLAAVMTLVVLLSACGDDDDEVATQPSTTVATQPSTTVTTGAHAGEDTGHEEAHEDPAKAPDRTIEVKMVENAFRPASFAVKAGETVKFVFHNDGRVVHEAILGTEADHVAHEKEMQELGTEMEHRGGQKPIRPGEMAEVVHTFKAGEELLFGCHLPGHYEAGHKAAIKVS